PTSGLAQYFRDNDAPGLPWHGPFIFGTEAGHIDAVSLIQSNFTAGPGIGNLEIIARAGDRLVFFWKEDAPGSSWQGPKFFGSGVSGNPSLIQGRFGTMGNFELVVPLVAGGFAHYWRDNDRPNLPWNGPFVFGREVGQINAISLIESNFSAGGG